MTIPEGWIETTLGDEIEIIGGGTPKTSIPEYWNGDIPWISIVDINNVNRWLTNTEKTITNEGLMNSSTKILNSGDLIISARGTVGEFAQIKKPMAFNQSCYGLRAKSNTINNFLYYLLKSYLSQIKKKSHGAVFDTITKETFDNIVIYLPPLSEQKEIADILSSFDDKIELLQEENKTLEAIAQNIFKEWFVNFNFPDENGKPYKSSGGKMIASDLGEIPEGWREGKLGDEFRVVMGQSPEGESYNETGEGIIFFQGRTDFKERFPEVRIYTTSPKRIAEKFDVLVSVRAPVGDINLASERCCIGRGLCALRSNLKSYALYKIKTLKNIFNNFEAEGTVFGSINKNSMLNIEVVFPSDDLLFRFEEQVNTLDQKIYNNHLQIKSLSTLRDSLLPKLLCKNVRMKGLK